MQAARGRGVGPQPRTARRALPHHGLTPPLACCPPWHLSSTHEWGCGVPQVPQPTHRRGAATSRVERDPPGHLGTARGRTGACTPACVHIGHTAPSQPRGAARVNPGGGTGPQARTGRRHPHWAPAGLASTPPRGDDHPRYHVTIPEKLLGGEKVSQLSFSPRLSFLVFSAHHTH